MTKQEQTAGTIENLATGCQKDKDEKIKDIDNLFQKLTQETHLAIELLNKELLNL